MNYTPMGLSQRLVWFEMTRSEEAVLKSMLLLCSSDYTLRCSMKQIAENARLSTRTVQGVLHGRVRPKKRGRPKKNQKIHVGLLDRNLIAVLSPADPRNWMPAEYQINEAAVLSLPVRPDIDRYWLQD